MDKKENTFSVFPVTEDTTKTEKRELSTKRKKEFYNISLPIKIMISNDLLDQWGVTTASLKQKGMFIWTDDENRK